MTTPTRTPGEILDIGPGADQNHFQVGIGYPTGHEDFLMSEVAAGFTDADYFGPTGDGWAARFSVGVDGGRTSNKTKYPRAELRELTRAGAKAAWDGARGVHVMQGASRFTALPPRKSWACAAQIHDAESDLVRIQTEGSLAASPRLRLVSRHTPPGGQEVTTTLIDDYRVGQWFAWHIAVSDGQGALYINGQRRAEFPAGVKGCYFKAGLYLQTNSSIDQRDQLGVVELRDLVVWHTGDPGSPPLVQAPPVPVPEPQPAPVPPVPDPAPQPVPAPPPVPEPPPGWAVVAPDPGQPPAAPGWLARALAWLLSWIRGGR